jgi:6-phosphofructokinase 1
MDTVFKLSEYAKSIHSPIRFVGIPKTIDNDLASTDHAPGYGSAAKYVATTVKELIRDVSVYTVKAVTIVEIMGRDAGWLTLATALPRISGGLEPDLIYLPEKVFDPEAFLNSVREALAKHPSVLITISEGIKLANGEYVGASNRLDAFGHKQLSGAGKVLEDLVRNEIGCKVRSMELSLTQRCAGHLLSATDIEESFTVAYKGVIAATEGHSGVMMTMVRADSAEYSISYTPKDIAKIANSVRTVPNEYINAEGNGITDAGVAYVKPLILGEVEQRYINGLPEHIIL